METAQWLMDSVIGPLYLVASEKGLRGVFWTKQEDPLANSLENKDPATRILSQAVQELSEYLNGQRKSFDLPLDIQGTEFQKLVWKELAQIPYGHTFSYSEIAKKLNSEKAVRAVGTANGRNPLCLIVPCHRVIAADGTLGGYSGGLEIKKKLLDLERSSISLT